MKNRKIVNGSKSQGALEFMIIMIFVLVIIGSIMYVTSILSIEINDKEKTAEIDNFALSLTSEFDLLSTVEEGYSRNITIPFHLAKKFKPEINSNFLVLTDPENDNNISNKHYYYLPENTTYTLTNDSLGNYYLYIFKNVTIMHNEITLINN